MGILDFSSIYAYLKVYRGMSLESAIKITAISDEVRFDHWRMDNEIVLAIGDHSAQQ